MTAFTLGVPGRSPGASAAIVIATLFITQWVLALLRYDPLDYEGTPSAEAFPVAVLAGTASAVGILALLALSAGFRRARARP
jgi:hypothetical protein